MLTTICHFFNFVQVTLLFLILNKVSLHHVLFLVGLCDVIKYDFLKKYNVFNASGGFMQAKINTLP